MQRELIHRVFQNGWILSANQRFKHTKLKFAFKTGANRPSQLPYRRRPIDMKGATLGTVDVFKGMSLANFAKAMRISNQDIIKAAARVCPEVFRGRRSEKHQTLPDMEMFTKIGGMFDFQVCFVKNTQKKAVDKDEYPQPPAPPDQLLPRAPVVTIMGHVDHGKTTLLDALRESRIVDSEFGGITQHIGAFSVELSSLSHRPRITFLDTPGHAAFSAMRQRGASATDIVVLVVAADDGVMPQTEESIRFASIARVPIIVAVNKIDSAKANVENVLNDLVMRTPLLPEGHGGDVQCVPISALKRTNLQLLQEAIVAQAELMELRSEMEGPAEAVVVESQFEKGRGKVATLLLRRGCLKVGATLVAGTAVCRVRSMTNELGQRQQTARPSDPVEVSGWRELPMAGDLVLQVKNESRATEVQRFRQSQIQKDKGEKDLAEYQQSMSGFKERYKEYRKEVLKLGNSRWARRQLTGLYPTRDVRCESEERPKLHVLIKGDVAGSVEAIVQTLSQIQSSALFELSIVGSGVGDVNESDVELAEAFEAIIYAFNVPLSSKMRDAADAAGVRTREFNVIYHLAHDVRDEIQAVIPKRTKLEQLGSANVLQIFMVSRDGTRSKVAVAGCFCDSGVLRSDAVFRILRDTDHSSGEKEAQLKARDEDEDEEEEEEEELFTVIYEGPCSSMFHKRDRVTSTKKNSECGLQFLTPDGEAFPLQVGDRIECYEEIEYQPEADIEFDFE